MQKSEGKTALETLEVTSRVSSRYQRLAEKRTRIRSSYPSIPGPFSCDRQVDKVGIFERSALQSF